MKLAIIGSGLSGLVLANKLDGKADITLFEKSRGVSGRMTTRYADPYQFDHGAQYFTARSEAFKEFLAPFIEAGVVVEWKPKVVTLSPNEEPYKRDWFEPHYVGAPRMNALAKALAEGREIQLQTEITTLKREVQGWMLRDKEGKLHGPFDWVISTAPAAQTHKLMPDLLGEHSVTMTGCYSVMLGFADAPSLNWQAAVVKDSPIGWMAVNSSKPGRETDFSLLVQSTNEWAEAHIDDDLGAAELMLMDAICTLIPDLPVADHIALHRWRYADTPGPLGEDFLIDETAGLAACGDWCVGGRIEAAFTSANALAEKWKNL